VHTVDDRTINEYGAVGGMGPGTGNPLHPTINPKGPDLVSKPGRCGGK
jgi:hypothetical protein